MAETFGDRILKLEGLVATLLERADTLRRDITAYAVSQGKTSDGHNALLVKFAALEQIVLELKSWKEQAALTELVTAVALLKDQMAELKASKEESSKRRWSVLPALVGAVLGGCLTLGGNLLIRYLSKP